MADRVALIGGSTVGRDHFPFPVTDLTEPSGDGTPYPFSMTLEETLHFLFICKTFQVTVGAITWQGGVGLFSGFEHEWYRTKNYPDVAEAVSRESELVVHYNNYGGGEIEERAGGGQSYTYFSPFFNGGSASWEGGVFRPYFDFGFAYEETDEQTESPNFDFIAVRTYDEEERGVVSGTLTFTTSLISRTCPLYKQFNDYECDITVDCIEYWPYETSNGDPVYDTATGAQLRDALS